MRYKPFRMINSARSYVLLLTETSQTLHTNGHTHARTRTRTSLWQYTLTTKYTHYRRQRGEARTAQRYKLSVSTPTRTQWRDDPPSKTLRMRLPFTTLRDVNKPEEVNRLRSERELMPLTTECLSPHSNEPTSHVQVCASLVTH